MVTPKVRGKQCWYQVKFFCRIQGETRIFSDIRWPVEAFLRSYVFYFKHQKTGEVSYRAVDEVMSRN